MSPLASLDDWWWGDLPASLTFSLLFLPRIDSSYDAQDE